MTWTSNQWAMGFYAFMWLLSAIGMCEAWMIYYKGQASSPTAEIPPPPRLMFFFLSFFWGITMPTIMLLITTHILFSIYQGEFVSIQKTDEFDVGDDDDFEV